MYLYTFRRKTNNFPKIETSKIMKNQFKWVLPTSHWLTFEERHQSAPAGDSALAMELPQRQLHVEERNAAHHQHYAVRHQECS